MDYTHNLKIYRQPDTLERSSYYAGVRTISGAITRSHLARSYSKIGQKHFITGTIHLSDGLGVAHIKCHTTYKSKSIVPVWTPGTVTLRLLPVKSGAS